MVLVNSLKIETLKSIDVSPYELAFKALIVKLGVEENNWHFYGFYIKKMERKKCY